MKEIPEARSVDVGDQTLAVVDVGPEDALPVVFIHGFPFSHRMWEPQLRAFSDDFRLVAYDIRGHGQSPVGDGQYTIELFVDDLFGLLDRLEIEEVVGCGLSMGGYVLLRALEREPERFGGVVLCDTRSEADTDEGRLKRVAAIRALKGEGASAYADTFLPLVLAPETLDARPEIVAAVREMIAANPVEGMVGAQIAMAARTDTTDLLRQIEAPTLVIVGERDELTPPATAREMAQRIPGAGVTVVSRAGHLSNLENPDGFNDALRPFLEGLRE